jgi:hypothetical protein
MVDHGHGRWLKLAGAGANRCGVAQKLTASSAKERAHAGDPYLQHGRAMEGRQ